MRIKEFLIEYNRTKTFQNWGQKILTAAMKDTGLGFRKNLNLKLDDTGIRVVNALLAMLEKADPTKNKQYVQALARQDIHYTITGEFSASLSDFLK